MPEICSRSVELRTTTTEDNFFLKRDKKMANIPTQAFSHDKIDRLDGRFAITFNS